MSVALHSCSCITQLHVYVCDIAPCFGVFGRMRRVNLVRLLMS